MKIRYLSQKQTKFIIKMILFRKIQIKKKERKANHIQVKKFINQINIMKDIMIIIKKEAIVDIIKKIARIIIKIIEINLF